MVKNPPANAGDTRDVGSNLGVGNNTPIFLPGKFHGQRSLADYSLRGHKELDMTEQLSTQASPLRTCILSCLKK